MHCSRFHVNHIDLYLHWADRCSDGGGGGREVWKGAYQRHWLQLQPGHRWARRLIKQTSPPTTYSEGRRQLQKGGGHMCVRAAIFCKFAVGGRRIMPPDPHCRELHASNNTIRANVDRCAASGMMCFGPQTSFWHTDPKNKKLVG